MSAEEKRYRIVAWYSHDGRNPNVVPFARIVEVKAASPDLANLKGEKELERVYKERNESVDFLNWYIEELP